jgi:type IV pilus assembly protein PilE
MNTQRNPHRSRRMRGVSLIELLTVLTIVAILGSLAVGAYGRYSLRANRTDAKAALLRIQVAEEKFFLGNNTYTTDFTSAPPTGLGVQSGANTNNSRYTITLAAGSSGSIATSYLATATAINGQTQDDSNCAVFTINDRGDRTPADSTGCWK